MKKIVIEGNAVYEIDEECLKKREEKQEKENKEKEKKDQEKEKGCN